MNTLSDIEKGKVKASYFNLLALFLTAPQVDSRFVRCLIKWSVQLGISPDDMVKLGKDLNQLNYSKPEGREACLNSLFHLVYMIYLDKVMEDEELELAMVYAQKIGFEKEIVPKLFQSIATASEDGITPEMLEKEVIDFFSDQL